MSLKNVILFVFVVFYFPHLPFEIAYENTKCEKSENLENPLKATSKTNSVIFLFNWTIRNL